MEGLFKSSGITSTVDQVNKLESMQTHVRNLRTKYSEAHCQVDYSDQDLRETYMLAYFPHYIEPVHYLLERLPKSITGRLFSRKQLRIAAFGSGPAPELLGVASYIQEHYPAMEQISLCLLDNHNTDWKSCLDICTDSLLPHYWTNAIQKGKINCDIEADCKGCIRANFCNIHIPDASLFVVQNCLNDLSVDPQPFINKLANYFEAAKPGAVMLVVDLNFGDVRNTMLKIEKEMLVRGIATTLACVEKSAHKHTSKFQYPDIISRHLLTGAYLLNQKKHVYNYSLALVRR